MSVAAMVGDDLDAVSAFVREQVAAGISKEFVIDQQSKALVSRLTNLGSLTCGECTQLTRKINGGPWPPPQRQLLANTVLALTTNVVVKQPRRRCQSCPHFEQYLSCPEWTGLQSKAVLCAKIGQCCGRANSIGLIHPNEPTSWRIASIICTTHQITTKDECVQVFEDVKRGILELATKRPYPLQYIVDYPATPALLPKDVYAFAYRDDAPVQAVLPELDHAMQGGKMRKNKTKSNSVVDALREAFAAAKTDGPSSSKSSFEMFPGAHTTAVAVPSSGQRHEIPHQSADPAGTAAAPNLGGQMGMFAF